MNVAPPHTANCYVPLNFRSNVIAIQTNHYCLVCASYKLVGLEDKNSFGKHIHG